MNKSEFDFIFGYVFAEEKEKPAAPVKALWWDQFGNLSNAEGVRAARELKTRKLYGAAKTFDFWQVVRDLRKEHLPESLKMTPQAALSSLNLQKSLIADAATFADRAVPGVGGREQFKDPGDLQKANHINKAIWEREFKDRFSRQQGAALRLVEQGAEPTVAIRQVCGCSSSFALTAPEKSLLSNVFEGV